MLAWTDQLYLGEPLIDSQHKELIDFANYLFLAISDMKGSDEINRTMNFLTEHCLKHFADEERLMKEHEFPGLSAHIDEHLKIHADVVAYKDQLASRGSSQSFAEDVSEWLEECIYHHLYKVDVHFRNYIKSKSELAAPANSE